MFAASLQALHQLLGLGLAELGIDQHGIVLATDNHRADRENGRVPGVVDVQLQRSGSQRRAGQGHAGQ